MLHCVRIDIKRDSTISSLSLSSSKNSVDLGRTG
jgi:hypothetical protein